MFRRPLTFLSKRLVSTQITKYKYGGKLVSNETPDNIRSRYERKVISQYSEPRFWQQLLDKRETHQRSIFQIAKSFWRHFQDRAMDSNKMDIAKCDLLPSGNVRGMKSLDRSAFVKDTYVPGLTVPMAFINDFSKQFKNIFLKTPGIKPWAQLPETDQLYSSHKLILLNPKKFTGLDSLSDAQKQCIKDYQVNEDSVKLYDLHMTYQNWTYHELLSAILPDESDGVAGFSSIGHILHLNLREDVMDYKTIIGDILIDKISNARTVVNKLNTIDNTFRNFKMELLAGEDDMVTIAKENGLEFHLDFSKVYWNPRLGTEHRRVVECIRKSDVLYDVFAGIGPFAVPAAKKGATVFANDLNPESYHWLQHNLKCNKVRGENVTYNMDGRDFIRTVIKDDLLKQWSAESQSTRSLHIAMNLPALAIEFLDAFCGLFDEQSDWPSFKLPRVYCYGFSKAEDTQTDICERVEGILGATLDHDDSEMRFVRNVAPGKDMICAVFTMPAEVLFKSRQAEVTDESPPKKRSKTDGDESGDT